MKRRVAFILLLLVGGAIANIAVAWGLAMRLPQPLGCDSCVQAGSGDNTLLLQHRPGEARVMAQAGGGVLEAWHRTVDQSAFDRMLPRASRFHDAQWVGEQVETAKQRGMSATVMEHTHGWPLLAMTGTLTVAFPAPSSPSVVADGLKDIEPIPGNPSFRRLLPLRLISPGFAVNTLFYAGVLWLLFAAPFALRRGRRIKRGLCPKCAYPIGASDVCTECGAAVTPRRGDGV